MNTPEGPPSPAEVRTRIRRYFSEVIPRDVDDDDDIFQRGIVDSLFAMQLILFVEKEFCVVAEREDLDIENFTSISALTKFVTRKQRDI